METVSVIVPIYKVEKDLERCIQSLVNQTYRNIEIILVDDGSPDNCGNICDAYANKDARIIVLHKKNGGLSDARNTGVKKATGDYILFVDSDDYIHETTVQKTLEEAVRHDADIILFDYVEVRGEEYIPKICGFTERVPMTLRQTPELLFAPPSACNRLFKSSFYYQQKLEFPKGRHYEDLSTTPKFLLKAAKIIYIPEMLYYYVIREESIMGSKDFQKNYTDRTAVIDELIEYYKEQGAYEIYKVQLEYIAFLNAYFTPLREIILCDYNNPAISKFRQYIKTRFPDYRSNPYLTRLTKKERWHLSVIESKQYWLMALLSKARQMKENMFHN